MIIYRLRFIHCGNSKTDKPAELPIFARKETNMGKCAYVAALLTVAFVLALSACSSQKRVAAEKTKTLRSPEIIAGQEYSPSTLIVFYDATIGKQSLLRAAKKMKCDVIYDYNIVNAVALRIAEGENINEVAEKLKKVKGVVSVQRDRIMHLDSSKANNQIQ